MKNSLLAVLLSFFLTVIFGFIAIPVYKKIKLGQPILKYVENHSEKQGTPTMGGLFFIIPSCIVFLIFSEVKLKIAIVAMCVGLAYMFVGFLDDFIKVKLSHNEGLKPYQKIIFQASIAIFAGLFCYINGLTVYYIPFTSITCDLGVFTLFFVPFIFIAITNGVNLTDGLDGLAGSVSSAYLFFMAILIFLEIKEFGYRYSSVSEYQNLMILSFALLGGVLGFLVFNVNKAHVFMGDTGSLALGGFIGVISIFSANSFFIPIIGIMFVITCISVIVQVLYFKKTGKRVFLMAPLHHHFQMKGNSETQISYWYFIITCIMGIFSLIAFL